MNSDLIEETGSMIKTVQKVGQTPLISTLSTPHPTAFSYSHPSNKKRVKHVTMKLLRQELRVLLREGPKPQDGIILYQLFGRINSITPTLHAYQISFTDQTANFPIDIFILKPKPQNLQKYISNSTTEQDQPIGELQFEPTPKEGQPYFRLWARPVLEQSEGRKEAKLSIERIEKVWDSNQLIFHSAKAMQVVLSDYRKSSE